MNFNKKIIDLPIDSHITTIRAHIANGAKQIIVHASPGSGKTTRVPAGILEAFSHQVWVLEPRRLAAKMSALRVDSELTATDPCNKGVVGWQMRDDTKMTEKTKLLFLTEGMLPLRMIQSTILTDVSCIVLDEFHERHAQTDLAFALCRMLQNTTRPDLVLIIMSATLEIETLMTLMPSAVLVDCPVPVYPVKHLWWKGDEQKPLSDKVVEGFAMLDNLPEHRGHVLVFLPGSKEIKQAKDALSYYLQNHLKSAGTTWDILELRGSLPRTEQENVFLDFGKRKIILATNIAESSVTIPGVTSVIDCGLAKVPVYSPWTLLPTLETKAISQASLVQRSGRAGRTAPGVAIRLFSEHEYARRQAQDVPEILRADLSGFLLNILGIKERSKSQWTPEELPWPSPPPKTSWSLATDLLVQLNLIESKPNSSETMPGSLVDLSHADWPIHPRIIRFLTECERLGFAAEGAWLSAVLSLDHISITKPDGTDYLGCDLLVMYESVIKNQNKPQFYEIARLAKQLNKLTNCSQTILRPANDLEIESALLSAFADRVARRHVEHGSTMNSSYTLSNGVEARLDGSSAAHGSEWIVAWSIRATKSLTKMSTSGSHSKSGVYIGGATKISLDHLKCLKSSLVNKSKKSYWDDKVMKVRQVEQTSLGSIVLENVKGVAEGPEVQAILRNRLMEFWPMPFDSESPLRDFICRLKLIEAYGFSDYSWDYQEFKTLLIASICETGDGYQDILRKNLVEWLQECAGYREWSLLEDLTPRQLTVGAGSVVAVNYEEGKTPWIEARLQNFFGQKLTPKIMKNKIAVAIHLLAPNMRSLQVTTDLESFWKTTYSSLRNEYMRKYPRHYWPENPLDSEPPVRGSLKPRTNK